jgi:hypothetical protein
MCGISVGARTCVVYQVGACTCVVYQVGACTCVVYQLELVHVWYMSYNLYMCDISVFYVKNQRLMKKT